MMTKKLSKHGNSLALVIDRSILELLGIDEQTSLEISTDGRALVITPANDSRRRKRFQQALSDCNEQYGEALKRLKSHVAHRHKQLPIILGDGHFSRIRPIESVWRRRLPNDVVGEQLEGALQKRYGYAKDKAREEVDTWTRGLN